jgi:hypothetical protein
MANMDIGVQFRVVYDDTDVIELRISGWNGEFGGVTDLYEGISDLQDAANKLRGFPVSPSDRREVVFGTLDRTLAGGGVKLRFHCIDGAGHAYVEATIDTNCQSGGTIQTVVFAMPLEATAIDAFVQDLERLEADRAGTAHLKGIAPA